MSSNSLVIIMSFHATSFLKAEEAKVDRRGGKGVILEIQYGEFQDVYLYIYTDIYI